MCGYRFQAAVHYVAMTPEGRIFDNSLMKGTPYYIRIGSGAVRTWMPDLICVNTLLQVKILS